MPVAEEAKVTDALESVRQDMDEKSPDELFGWQSHRLLSMVVAVIVPMKSHPAIVDVEQTVIGNGHTVGIAADVMEHLLGPGKRRLGVNHPFALGERSQIGAEGVGIAQFFQRPEEV